MSIWYDKKGKEYASKGKISWLKVYAEYLVKNLRDEILAKLNFHYDGLEGRHSAENIDFNSELDVKSAIEKETNQRITVDTSLQASIDAETLQRSTADTSLQTAIETEVSARKENDNSLQTFINNETENRSNADQLLKQNIDDEVSERINSDNNLQSQIDSEKQKLDNLSAKVLTKDNTTEYSPTSNYHPATKKYVDDIAMKAGTGDMLTSVYDMNGNGIVDNAEKLGGVEAEKYALQTYVQEKTDKIMSDLTGPSYNVNVKIGESIPTNATKLVGVTSSTEISWYGVNVEFGNAEYVVLENGDTVPDAVKGGTIISIMGQAEWGDTFLGDNDYATFECQGVGLVESQLNTPPELTATSPDGTMIGSDGWTGTGFVCTAANTKYVTKASNIASAISGFNRFCLRFADTSGNKWKNWSPWLDVNGVAYEFFYSPTRRLYEALIPATTKTAEEIVSSIRWERAEPDVIRYGKISNMFSINSVVSDETETVYYNMYTDEASLRDYSGKYTDDDSKVAMAFSGGEITLPADNIPNNIIHKLFLALDINCDGEFKPAEVAAISRKVKSAAVFTVETIDNFA